MYPFFINNIKHFLYYFILQNIFYKILSSFTQYYLYMTVLSNEKVK